MNVHSHTFSLGIGSMNCLRDLFLIFLLQYADVDSSPQWPEAYHFKATLKIPSANVIEPYEVWSNGAQGHRRFDFYKGMNKMYQKRRGKVQDVVQFQYFWVSPEPTNVNKDSNVVCHQISASSGEVKRLQHFLPPSVNFRETGPDVNGTTKWDFQFTGSQYEAVYKYALWTSGSGNNWVPTKYEYRMFYQGVEREFIQHVYEKFNRTKPDADVYKISRDLRCSSLPGKDVNEGIEYNSYFANPDIQIIPKHNVSEEFERFKATHNKQYKTDKEHFKRFMVFLNNFRYIQSVNRQQKSYELTVNKFTDMTEDELSALNGIKIEPDLMNPRQKFVDNDQDNEDFDWRWYGAVTSVKDQTFLCGSCYAFTTAAAIESAFYVSKGCQDLVELSEQAIIDCSRGQNGNGNQGCNGGLLGTSLRWVKAHGIPSREDYGPYLATEGYCHLEKSSLMHIHSYKTLPADIKAIKAALREHGPLAAVMHVPGSLYYYRTGIYDDNKCLSTHGSQTHAVVIIGYGTENGKRYWLVKNSWGSQWGEAGYFKLDMENNLCGITSLVYAIVQPISLVKHCRKIEDSIVIENYVKKARKGGKRERLSDVYHYGN